MSQYYEMPKNEWIDGASVDELRDAYRELIDYTQGLEDEMMASYTY